MIILVFQKKSGFGVFLVQQNKVENTLPDGLRPLVEGHIAYFGIFIFHFFEFCVLGNFSVFQKNQVLEDSWSTLLWY